VVQIAGVERRVTDRGQPAKGFLFELVFGHLNVEIITTRNEHMLEKIIFWAELVANAQKLSDLSTWRWIYRQSHYVHPLNISRKRVDFLAKNRHIARTCRLDRHDII
jgi:hypothetical protein